MPYSTNSPAMSASYLRLLLQLGERHGMSQQQLLHNTGIVLAQLQDHDFIGMGEAATLLGNSNGLFEKPGMGLELGQSLQLAAHGLMSHIAVGADNLLTSILAFQRFIRLRTSLLELEVDICGDFVTIGVILQENFQGLNRFILEAAVSGCCNLSRYLCTNDPIDRIAFSFDAPAPKLYRRALATQLQFDSPQTMIHMHLSELTNPSQTANAELFALAQQ